MEETGLITYWLINIAIAIAIFFVGRIVVKWIVKLIRKLMIRNEVDPILVNFVAAIANAILLLFVVVASLDQLGV